MHQEGLTLECTNPMCVLSLSGCGTICNDQTHDWPTDYKNAPLQALVRFSFSQTPEANTDDCTATSEAVLPRISHIGFDPVENLIDLSPTHSLPWGRPVVDLKSWGSSELRLTAAPFPYLFPQPYRDPVMRSRSLLARLSLVLTLRMGVLAQLQLAVCRPGWEWVCHVLSLLGFLGQRGRKALWECQSQTEEI